MREHVYHVFHFISIDFVLNDQKNFVLQRCMSYICKMKPRNTGDGMMNDEDEENEEEEAEEKMNTRAK